MILLGPILMFAMLFTCAAVNDRRLTPQDYEELARLRTEEETQQQEAYERELDRWPVPALENVEV